MRLLLFPTLIVALSTGHQYVGSETEVVDDIVAVEPWARGGAVEHRLHDGTRVDILTATHAIEADWSHKWAEAVGQSLYYSLITGKKPGARPAEDADD